VTQRVVSVVGMNHDGDEFGRRRRRRWWRSRRWWNIRYFRRTRSHNTNETPDQEGEQHDSHESIQHVDENHCVSIRSNLFFLSTNEDQVIRKEKRRNRNFEGQIGFLGPPPRRPRCLHGIRGNRKIQKYGRQLFWPNPTPKSGLLRVRQIVQTGSYSMRDHFEEIIAARTVSVDRCRSRPRRHCTSRHTSG
jgi:hypothetical protein